MNEAVSTPIIVVVTVNYCTASLVINSLCSLQNERRAFPNLCAVIVDNASPDNSVKNIESAVESNQWSSWVKVVAAEKNGGFAYGNNRGFSEAASWLGSIDYFWMLNPDVEVLPGATKALIDFLSQNPEVIAGSGLQDRDGTKQVSAFNFPSVYSESASGFGWGVLDRLLKKRLVRRSIPSSPEQCDWLAGASVMFSSKVFESIGLMDEHYFLYFEEVDYFLSANKKGFSCWYVPQSKVIHEMGAATGISDARKKQPRRPKYWFDSRRRYYLKNHGRLYLFLSDALWSIGYCSWLIRKKLTGSSDLSLSPPYLLTDFLIASQLNPLNWLKKRI